MAATEKQIITDVKKGKISPVYLLTGEENYSIDTLSDFFEHEVVPEENQCFDQIVVYGRDVEMGAIIDIAKQYPTMPTSTHRLILVKEAQNIQDWTLLPIYLEHPSNTSVIVFCYRHKKMDKRTQAYKAIAAKGTVFEKARLYDDKVPEWIINHSEEKGYHISQQSAALLAEALGNDLGKIANEMSKVFISLPQGGTVTNDIIERNIGISKDYNVFELQSALIQGNILKANRITRYFADSKDHPMVKELGILFTFFANLMIYHYLQDKNDHAVASVLGVPPFFVKDYAMAAKRYNAGKTFRIIGYFRETDARLKGINNPSAKESDLWKELIYKILH